MNGFLNILLLVTLFSGAFQAAWSAEAPQAGIPRDGSWVEPMQRVHARFRGTNGTFAHFGDSITVTMAFWTPLQGQPKNMNPALSHAHQVVRSYQKPECWRWKGPEFGNNGSMTIGWARQHVERWLTQINPEVVLIMFGSNDVGQMEIAEYETKTREVVTRCLSNGTVVILTTAPPRHGLVEKSRSFAEAVRKIAREQHLPLIDYAAEIMKRRPEDWDGALPAFEKFPGDEYQVPTLIAKDGVHPSNPKQFNGDYSEEALRNNGYGLRNYLTMLVYAEVIEQVLRSK
jgi:hypothetical protein